MTPKLTDQPNWFLIALAVLTALFVWTRVALGDEGKSSAGAPSGALGAMSRYCAREGETIDQRIARLEVALRLAKAERRVNRK
jgi:hypothetical protein